MDDVIVQLEDLRRAGNADEAAAERLRAQAGQLRSSLATRRCARGHMRHVASFACWTALIREARAVCQGDSMRPFIHTGHVNAAACWSAPRRCSVGRAASSALAEAPWAFWEPSQWHTVVMRRGVG